MKMRTRSWLAVGAIASLTLGLVACTQAEPAAEGDMEPGAAGERAAVTFTATEYAYDGPESIPAGRTEIVLANEGKQSHALLLMGMPEGKTMADIEAALKAVDTPIPAWMTFPGGVAGIEAGKRARAVLDLAEGSYAMVSFESAPGDDTPDFAKGMLRALTVTAADGAEAAAPESSVTVDLNDFSFTTQGTLASGEQMLQIANIGKEPHEAIIMRLAEGATAADFVSMLTSTEPPSGPPPVSSAGGMGPLSPGKSGFVSVDFEPGNYMFICFVPSAADGKPHATLGMVKEFTVQ